MLKSGNNNNNNVTNNNNTISLATSAVHNMASTAMTGDYGSEYGKMTNTSAFAQRDRLADGLNNITKSILQQRGVSGQQLELHDDIPLRPLLLNGSQNQANPANNLQGQNNE